MSSPGVSYVWFFKMWSFRITLKGRTIVFVAHPTSARQCILNYDARDYWRRLISKRRRR